MTDVLSVLIWVHPVCKGNKQMTKVAASKERVNLPYWSGIVNFRLLAAV